MVHKRRERLQEFYRRLRDAPDATTAEEAFSLLCAILEQVEDDLSGIPKSTPPPPPHRGDGRMYPPRPDFTARHPDGTIIAMTKLHLIEIGAQGSIRITNQRTGTVDFQKGQMGDV